MTKETIVNLKLGGVIVITSVVASLITGIATYSFSYGYYQRAEKAQEEKFKAQSDRIVSLQHSIELLEAECKEYTNLEVGGLRSDWERELKHK